MIQESRLLIEMADTVQEKILQCQKAGNVLTKKTTYFETSLIILDSFLRCSVPLKIQVFCDVT